MLKLDNYMPTFRNVLLKEVKEDKTAGGIYIPLSAKRQDETLYEVVKVGKDCTEVMPDHQVYLGPHSSYTTRVIEGQEYLVVNEIQIEGKFSKPATMDDFGHVEVTRRPRTLEEEVEISREKKEIKTRKREEEYKQWKENLRYNLQNKDLDDSFRTSHPSEPEATGSSLI